MHTRTPTVLHFATLLFLAPACGSTRASGGESAGTGLDDGAASEGSEGTAETGGGEGDDAAPRLDAAAGVDLPGSDACGVVWGGPDGGINGVGNCTEAAPPDSFEPEIQWAFEEDEFRSIATPLVANMTDDNGDGRVDLCDTPDVVIAGWRADPEAARPGPRIVVLDGETGAFHNDSGPDDIAWLVTPAIGDLDLDGRPEVITVTCPQQQGPECVGRVAGIAGDGTRLWTGDEIRTFQDVVALGDVDNDDSAEILIGRTLYDRHGITRTKFDVSTSGGSVYSIPTLVDLDGDDDLEVLFGSRAFHHDGTLFWSVNLLRGHAQIANFDDDPFPEILMTSPNGVSLLEHDGRVRFAELRPTGVEAAGLNWVRPAAIHDMDGDGRAEFAVSSATQYGVYEDNGALKWSAPVVEISGIAGGTAFDFLGDGEAEAMYADEENMFVFDGSGQTLLSIARVSKTGSEYPVVADVDNDGSAEIVVVSNVPYFRAGDPESKRDLRSPGVQVVRDVEDRWMPARRIWNQDTYHVTNVLEDGRIPRVEAKNWRTLNTFRTQAQVNEDGVCRPPPPRPAG